MRGAELIEVLMWVAPGGIGPRLHRHCSVLGSCSHGLSVVIVVIPLVIEKVDEALDHAAAASHVALSVGDTSPLDLCILSPQALEHGLRQGQPGREMYGRVVVLLGSDTGSLSGQKK